MGLYRITRTASLRLLGCLLVAALSFMPALASADKGDFYQQTNLVSDQAGGAQFQDPNLVNAWGLSHSATSPWWVSDNGTGKSTLYNGAGTVLSLVVTIPTPPGDTSPATPTGNIFNTSPGFVVSANSNSGASRFIFATEEGTISGWTPLVDPTRAILAVDRSAVGDGAVYKGLAMGQSHGSAFLYATNFRFGTVEMFDEQFNLVRSFTDPKLVKKCRDHDGCFAPFGIQNINGKLFVTFALQDKDKKDDVAGPGNGFVDVFDTDGNLLSRFAEHGHLNAPWGLALAPADFGRFSNALLVGNFGNGRINAFNPKDGHFLGELKDKRDHPIAIDGLWAVAFGNGAQAGGLNELFFTAGPDDEQHGLFGKIQAMNTGH